MLDMTIIVGSMTTVVKHFNMLNTEQRPASASRGKEMKMELTTKAAMSDNADAAEVADHPQATDGERTAAAHVMGAYDLRTVCDSSDVAIVQAAGKRLMLW